MFLVLQASWFSVNKYKGVLFEVSAMVSAQQNMSEKPGWESPSSRCHDAKDYVIMTIAGHKLINPDNITHLPDMQIKMI